MKIVHESIFAHALRAFFVALFGVLGVVIALALVIGGLGIFTSDGDKLPSQVTILSDADGHRKALGKNAPVILQLSVQGEIGKEQLTGKKIEEILLKSREDELKGERVKGILLVINSPGGGVNDSDIIYRHLRHYQEKFQVPVYAYVDGVCASGGYYIACAADRIYASDVSLVGSIGVLAWPPFVNVYDALEKIGISSITVSAGKGKDGMNPLRPWKEGEQISYQKLIDFYYDRFTTLVSERRPEIDQEKLVSLYGAEVFPAPIAQEAGLIDKSNYEREAVLRELALAAGIKDEKYQVITFETKTWWKKALLKENIEHKHIFSPELKRESCHPFSYL